MANDSLSTEAAVRTCSECRCRLARDNRDTICWPCRRSRAIAAQERSAIELRRREAFENDRIPGLARQMRTSTEGAIRYAIEDGLLSRRWRPHLGNLVRLAAMEDTTHVEAAKALGVSRWTVADWRRHLGLGTRPGAVKPPRSRCSLTPEE